MELSNKFALMLKPAIAAALCLGAPAAAQDDSREAWAAWQTASTETASAERMLGGDVTNGFNMLGNISDLILNETGTQIEYILYEVPFPWSVYGNDDGFVRWDNVAIERGAGFDLDLRIDREAKPYSKDQLTITRSEADDRLASRIIGGKIVFADGAVREIGDILFDPETGMLTDYVVEMNEESLFPDDTRMVPASLVTLDTAGVWRVSQPADYDYRIWIF